MNKFLFLEDYQIPKSMFINFINIYKTISYHTSKIESLKSKEHYLISHNIAKDTYFLVKHYLNLSVSEQRLRLLIDKDSNAKNKEELIVKNAYNIIKSLYNNAIIYDFTINSSDILDIIKKLTNKNIKFKQDDFKIKESQNNKNLKSVRFTFNEVLDNYNKLSTYSDNEPILLLSTTVMEMYNINPYSESNDIALYIFYFYSLLRSGILSFKYISFFELFTKYLDSFKESIIKGSMNYDQNVLFFKPLVTLTLSIIEDSYEQLDKLIDNSLFEDTIRKSDSIELIIMSKVAKIFSKDDIIKLYPDISPTTVMRVLKKLQAKGIIIPLGKGRSARWQRIIEQDNIKYILGEDFNND